MVDQTEVKWELHDVSDRECVMDDSGFYTSIHRQTGTDKLLRIRCDIMRSSDNEPMVSYRARIDSARHAINDSVSAVRKAVIDWFAQNANNTFDRWTASGEKDTRISAEHASYIGAELQRAANDPNYQQS